MTAPTGAFTVGPGQGPTIQGPAGGPLTFKVRGDQAGGALTVIENPSRRRRSAASRARRRGRGVVDRGGPAALQARRRATEAPTGSFVFVPRGVAHSFQNPGQTPARILVMFTPGGMETFFDSFGQLEEFDPEAFARLGAQVGMEVVGPPLGHRADRGSAGRSPDRTTRCTRVRRRSVIDGITRRRGLTSGLATELRWQSRALAARSPGQPPRSRRTWHSGTCSASGPPRRNPLGQPWSCRRRELIPPAPWAGAGLVWVVLIARR